jgi:FKBP-type peptidyl-prolyl cis-trans isomerase
MHPAVPLALVLAAFFSSCRQIGLQDRPVDIAREEVTTASGVHYSDTFVGNGPAANLGDEVVIDYTVWLDDGTRIDSTSDRGVPVTVQLGAAFVPGLDEGLLHMRPDGRRRIRVPAELAYGEKGVENLVPPDSDLVFDVHVLEVHPTAQARE